MVNLAQNPEKDSNDNRITCLYGFPGLSTCFVGDPNRGQGWLGSETTLLAHRKGMAQQGNGWTPDNRLPLFYDSFPDCRSSYAVIFYSLELEVGMSVAWLLCRHGFSRGLFLVCFKSTLWD